MFFKDYSKLWLDEVKQTNKYKTWSAYEECVRLFLRPEFGDMVLASITSGHVKGLLRKLATAGKSISRQKQVLACLRSCLNAAIIDNHVPVNVAKAVSVAGSTAGSHGHIPEDDTISGIRNAAVDTEMEALVEVAFGAGLRSGELRALTRASVDLDAATVSVTHTVVEDKGRIIGISAPKTKNGVRTVPLPARAVQALRRHMDTLTGDILFPSPGGGYLLKSTLHRRFKALLEKAGADDMRLHGTRHSFATRLFEAGVDPKAVQIWMGHFSFSFTHDTYHSMRRGALAVASAQAVEVLR